MKINTCKYICIKCWIIVDIFAFNVGCYTHSRHNTDQTLSERPTSLGIVKNQLENQSWRNTLYITTLSCEEVYGGPSINPSLCRETRVSPSTDVKITVDWLFICKYHILKNNNKKIFFSLHTFVHKILSRRQSANITCEILMRTHIDLAWIYFMSWNCWNAC